MRSAAAVLHPLTSASPVELGCANDATTGHRLTGNGAVFDGEWDVTLKGT